MQSHGAASASGDRCQDLDDFCGGGSQSCLAWLMPPDATSTRERRRQGFMYSLVPLMVTLLHC